MLLTRIYLFSKTTLGHDMRRRAFFENLEKRIGDEPELSGEKNQIRRGVDRALRIDLITRIAV